MPLYLDTPPSFWTSTSISAGRERSFSSQDVVTGRRLQCLSTHMRNGCKSSEYCCCEILTDRRLTISICSGLNAVPHPHKEYAHINPQSQIFLEKDAFMGLIRWDHPVLHGWALKSKSSVLRQSWEREERRWPCGDGARDWMMLLQAKECLESSEGGRDREWLCPEPREGSMALLSRPLKSEGFISGLWSTGLWENTFLWENKASKVAVICYSIPRKETLWYFPFQW